MPVDNQILIEYCQRVYQVADKARDWVERNVDDTRREADVAKLKKIRRLAKRFQQAAGKRPSVALFGESQVGKSYLVKTLGKLPDADMQEIVIPETGKRFSFFDIQPEGNNSETTGIVTRFTTERYPAKSGFPLYVSLLSQADIVKILAVAYLSNIKDREYEITEARQEEIDQKLLELTTLKSSTNEAQGLTEDDIYDIEEYIDFKAKNEDIVKSLKKNKFWYKIANVLPHIPYHRRVELFGFIWGQQPFFNQIFTMLSETLRQLNFSTWVLASVDAIIPKSETILTIQRYFALLDENSSSLKVVTHHGSEVNVDRNVLSSLIAELVLNVPDELAENENRQLFRQADLLDFPGARSPKQFQERSLMNGNKRDLLELFVRGKVTFLFDRYNDTSEISALGFCIHNKQCEVTDLPKLVATWIDRAIGNTPEKRLEREQRVSGMVVDKNISLVNQMFILFTKANADLVGSAQDTDGKPESHDGKWRTRYNNFFHDFLSNGGAYSWPDEWTGANGQYTPFKNIFPIRDPQFYEATIYKGVTLNGAGREQELKPEYKQRYKDMQTSFVASPHVKKYSYNPEECWNEFTQLNKSGIDYLLRYLTPACDPVIKYEQINDLARACGLELQTCLQTYHRGDEAEETKKAQAKARRFDAQFAVAQLNRNVTGRLLNALLLPEELCAQEYRDLVNKPVNDQLTKSPATADSTDLASLYDFAGSLGLLPEMDDPQKPLLDTEEVLKQLDEHWNCNRATTQETLAESGVVIKKSQLDEDSDSAATLSRNWLSQLTRQISNVAADEYYSNLLGLSRDMLELIVGQLKQNIERVGFQKELAKAVREEVRVFNPVTNPNFDLVARISCALLNKFIVSAGYAFLNENNRPTLTGTSRTIFSENRLLRQEKNALILTLPDKKIPGESIYTSWRLAIGDSFVANVRFAYGSDHPHLSDSAYQEFASLYADIP